MYNDIITQNVKLIDEKMIIKGKKFEIINGIKYLVYDVSRELQPTFCSRCGCEVSHIKEYKTRTVKTFINFDYPVLLKYRQRRFICDCGKTMNEFNSIVGKNNVLSNYLKLEIMKQCQFKHSFKTIAALLNISSETVINTFMENFSFVRKSFGEVICVDEFSAKIDADNPYACIIGNPVSKEIIDILPSRHKSYLAQYLGKIPREERLNVKIVNIDMWPAYKEVFKAYCWNCKIAVDPFHWIEHATKQFHKLRRRVEDEIDNTHIKSLLKNYWKSLTKQEGRLSEKEYYSKKLNTYTTERKIVERCINYDFRLEDSWHIIQEIYRFRDEFDYDSASNELYKIIKEIEELNIEEMNEIAKTYRNWFEEICNSFIRIGPYNKKTSNAFIEGKNRLVKEIKAFSCGFNNFDIYRARILYISSKGQWVIRKSKKRIPNRRRKKRARK